MPTTSQQVICVALWFQAHGRKIQYLTVFRPGLGLPSKWTHEKKKKLLCSVGNIHLMKSAKLQYKSKRKRAVSRSIRGPWMTKGLNYRLSLGPTLTASQPGIPAATATVISHHRGDRTPAREVHVSAQKARAKQPRATPNQTTLPSPPPRLPARFLQLHRKSAQRSAAFNALQPLVSLPNAPPIPLHSPLAHQAPAHRCGRDHRGSNPWRELAEAAGLELEPSIPWGSLFLLLALIASLDARRRAERSVLSFSCFFLSILRFLGVAMRRHGWQLPYHPLQVRPGWNFAPFLAGRASLSPVVTEDSMSLARIAGGGRVRVLGAGVRVLRVLRTLRWEEGVPVRGHGALHSAGETWDLLLGSSDAMLSWVSALCLACPGPFRSPSRCCLMGGCWSLGRCRIKCRLIMECVALQSGLFVW